MKCTWKRRKNAKRKLSKTLYFADGMMKNTLLVALLLGCLPFYTTAQCDSTQIIGNYQPANGDTLSGVYNISGNFSLLLGDTIYVRAYADSGCGAIEIIAAQDIIVAGVILADESGYPGGAGGLPGTVNNAAFLEACPSPTNQCGDVITFGGSGGLGANPPLGGGNGGANGVQGSGRKNRCLTLGDVGGRVGGSGGGGAGAGGSYGGSANNGGAGGSGSLATMSEPDPGCTNFPILAGPGGNGGISGIAYGSISGLDISIGAGGGGGSGGGRGRFAGTSGGSGGTGGGLVRLNAGGNLSFTGIISANGGPGAAGGNGGAGGSSPRCCTDLCPGVDEYTHTGGGGGGGGAGGGSGGGILLQVGGNATITGSLFARGADGGIAGMGGAASSMNRSGCFTSSNANMPAGNSGFAGGAGAGGRTKIFYNTCAPANNVAPSISVSGGAAGNGGPAALGTQYIGTDGSFVLDTLQPLRDTICFNGDPSTLISGPAQGGFGTITYQWQSQTNCTGPWANIPGATATNYNPPPGLTMTTCFRLEVSSGTCLEHSDTSRVFVQPLLTAIVDTLAGNIPACLGDSVLLSSSGGPGANYQWTLNGFPIPAATDSFYTARASGDYAIIISFPQGCDGFSPPTRINFDLPPAAFIAVLGDTILCPGESVSLQAFGNGTYQWLLNGIAIPGATSGLYTATTAGTYALQITSAGGCLGQASPVQVSMALPPMANLMAGGSTAFCQGDSVQLTATGGNSYAWLRDGQILPGILGSTISATSSGIYTAIAISPAGCRDTSQAISVQVDPIPNAQLSPAGLPVACKGDSVLFLAGGGGSYSWRFNMQPISDTTAFLFGTMPGDYTVIVSSPAGCRDTSLTYAMTWFPPISPQVTALGSPFICPGDSLTLQAQAVGAIASYSWLANDTLIQGANAATISVTEAGAYAAIITDINGCDYLSPLFVVFPGASPQAEILPQGTSPICDGDTLLLIGSGGNMFQWFRNGQIIPAAQDSSYWVTATGDYTLAVETGCGSDTSGIVSITVAAGPVAGFTYENLPENEVQLIDESISGAVWYWDFGNGMNSNLQNPLQVFPGPGEYLVTMITWDIFGCSDTISLIVGVTDPIFFIPNVFSPNEDGVNDWAQTRFDRLNAIDFRIFDRWGRVVFFSNEREEFWDGKIKGKKAPDGVYFYQLIAEDENEKEVRATGNITLVR